MLFRLESPDDLSPDWERHRAAVLILTAIGAGVRFMRWSGGDAPLTEVSLRIRAESAPPDSRSQ
jgi:hypothetical protein